MSVILSTHLKLETVGIEAFTGVDGQGAPAYATSVDYDVSVVRQDKVVIGADGSKLRTQLTLWIPFDASVAFPDERDRITFDGTQFIVAEVKAQRGAESNWRDESSTAQIVHNGKAFPHYLIDSRVDHFPLILPQGCVHNQRVCVCGEDRSQLSEIL